MCVCVCVGGGGGGRGDARAFSRDFILNLSPEKIKAPLFHGPLGAWTTNVCLFVCFVLALFVC